MVATCKEDELFRSFFLGTVIYMYPPETYKRCCILRVWETCWLRGSTMAFSVHQESTISPTSATPKRIFPYRTDEGEGGVGGFFARSSGVVRLHLQCRYDAERGEIEVKGYSRELG
jgi:hypothetical protein